MLSNHPHESRPAGCRLPLPSVTEDLGEGLEDLVQAEALQAQLLLQEGARVPL